MDDLLGPYVTLGIARRRTTSCLEESSQCMQSADGYGGRSNVASSAVDRIGHPDWQRAPRSVGQEAADVLSARDGDPFPHRKTTTRERMPTVAHDDG